MLMKQRVRRRDENEAQMMIAFRIFRSSPTHKRAQEMALACVASCLGPCRLVNSPYWNLKIDPADAFLPAIFLSRYLASLTQLLTPRVWRGVLIALSTTAAV